MRTEYKIFGLVALFLWVVAGIYAGWSKAYLGHLDWVGTIALILSGLLLFMCATYFWFVARRIDLRPEDRAESEIADGAGEIGFFSPGSYWPFGLALSAAIAGLGIVFWMNWLLALGLIAVLVAAGGLIFEYYTGTRGAH